MIHVDRIQCDNHHLMASDVGDMNPEIIVLPANITIWPACPLSPMMHSPPRPMTVVSLISTQTTHTSWTPRWLLCSLTRSARHKPPSPIVLSTPWRHGRVLSCFSFLREGEATPSIQVRHPPYGPYRPYGGWAGKQTLLAPHVSGLSGCFSAHGCLWLEANAAWKGYIAKASIRYHVGPFGYIIEDASCFYPLSFCSFITTSSIVAGELYPIVPLASQRQSLSSLFKQSEGPWHWGPNPGLYFVKFLHLIQRVSVNQNQNLSLYQHTCRNIHPTVIVIIIVVVVGHHAFPSPSWLRSHPGLLPPATWWRSLCHEAIRSSRCSLHLMRSPLWGPPTGRDALCQGSSARPGHCQVSVQQRWSDLLHYWLGIQRSHPCWDPCRLRRCPRSTQSDGAWPYPPSSRCGYELRWELLCCTPSGSDNHFWGCWENSIYPHAPTWHFWTTPPGRAEAATTRETSPRWQRQPIRGGYSGPGKTASVEALRGCSLEDGVSQSRRLGLTW